MAFFSATLDSEQSYSQFQGSLRMVPSAKGMKIDRDGTKTFNVEEVVEKA